MTTVKSVQMFTVLSTATYLKKCSAKVVLDKYTAYTPDITGMVPAQIWKINVLVTTEGSVYRSTIALSNKTLVYLKWLLEHGSDVLTQQRCGARVHMWRYRSPQFSHLDSSMFVHPVSDRGKKEKKRVGKKTLKTSAANRKFYNI